MAATRNRARSFGGGGGGGGLLGNLLMAYFGGQVGVDPGFAEAGALTEGAESFVGPYTAEQEGLMQKYKSGELMPFKGKNMIAKPRANELNMDFRANQLAQAGQTNEAIRQFRTLAPDRQSEAKGLSDIAVNAKVNEATKLDPITRAMKAYEADLARKQMAEGANISVVTSRGAIYNPANLEKYDKDVSPVAIDAAGSGYTKEVQDNIVGGIEAGQKAERLLRNQSTMFEKSKLQDEADIAGLKSGISSLPVQAEIQKTQLEAIKQGIKSGKYTVFGVDGLIDNDTGQVVREPTPRKSGVTAEGIKAALGEGGDIKVGAQPESSMPSRIPSKLPLVDLGGGKIFDPNTGKIIQQ